MKARFPALKRPPGNMITDPISDMLTCLRNGNRVGRESVSVPYSRLKEKIAEVLLKEGYIKAIAKKGKKIKKVLVIEPLRLNGVKRISKPSRRIYLKAKEIVPFRQGSGDIIFSTPKGILTAKEAKKEKIGGEALFSIW